MLTTERAIEILTPDRRPDYSPEEYDEALAMAREALRKKTEKAHARWEEETNTTVGCATRHFICTACGRSQSYGEADFCPWCGADMREDVNG